MSVELIPDHAAAALGRLIYRYQNKPGLAALVTSLVGGMQDLEQALHDFYSKRGIVAGEGQQLDAIGEIVGRARNSYGDDFYRILLYVAVGQNTSQANAAKVVAVFKLLTGSTKAKYENLGGGDLTLAGNAGLNGSDADIRFIYANLSQVIAAGTRLAYLYCFNPTSRFAFAGIEGTGRGFGTVNNAAAGGKLAGVKRNKIPFAFAGSSNSNAGYGTVKDPLVGGCYVKT